MYINQVDLLFDIVSELVLLLPEDKIFPLVKKNPQALALLTNPPQHIIDFAINEDPNLIEFVDNPTEELIKFVLKKNPELIQYIKNPDLNVSLRLIKQDIDTFLPLINNKDQTFYNKVIEINAKYIRYVPKEFLSDNILNSIIEINPDILEVLDKDKQNEDLCLKAVKIKGRSLRFVLNQTFEIIKSAINNDINAFKYLDSTICSKEELEEIRALMKIKKDNLIK